MKIPQFFEFSDNYVSLAEIEEYGTGNTVVEEPKIVVKNKSLFSTHDGGIDAETNVNILMPQYYEVYDHYKSTGYSIEYTRTFIGFTYPDIFDKTLWQIENYYWVEGQRQYLESEYFEEAAYIKGENDESFYLIMYNSNEFIKVYYTGGKAPEEVLEAIEHELNK